MPLSATPPNILLVCVDDMNPWMGCLQDQPFSHPQVVTPNLDRLASGSRCFTHAHCPAPICNPSRTAVLTGLHPTTSGVYGNYCWWRPHLENHPSLPEWFRRQGYTTAGAGKIFHHCIGFNPPDQWDEYCDLVFDDPWDRRSRINYPHIQPTDPPEGHPLSGLDYFVHEFDWGSLPIDENDYGDVRAATFTEQFLQRDHPRPFFLGCGFFHPHLPWYAPRRFFDLYDPDTLIVPADQRQARWEKIPEPGKQLAAVGPQGKDQYQVLRETGTLKQALHAYLAGISFVDSLIGRVLDALENSAYAENTAVIFYGDHGFHIGEKHHFGKQALWRESTQVPFLLRLPGETRGTRIPQAVSTLDIAATLADISGIEHCPDWDSQSLLPSPRGGSASSRPALCTYERENHAVITTDYRYIRYADESEELYNLVNDPLELDNIAGDPSSSATLAALRAHLPETVAPTAPGLDAYNFDWQAYRWTPKSFEF